MLATLATSGTVICPSSWAMPSTHTTLPPLQDNAGLQLHHSSESDVRPAATSCTISKHHGHLRLVVHTLLQFNGGLLHPQSFCPQKSYHSVYFLVRPFFKCSTIVNDCDVPNMSPDHSHGLSVKCGACTAV
jgi:hypothetical protein